MTLVTNPTGKKVRAMEGARRATGVALASVLARSPHRVVVLLNRPTVDPNLQFFQPHMVRFIRSDGRLDIFGEQYRLPSEAVYEYVVASIR
jgi:hypothetical protein